MALQQNEVKYILNDAGEVVPTTDLLAWAEWFQKSGKKRRVAYDEVGDFRISTVFLGVDHSFGKGSAPLLFETMVFYDVENNNLGKAKSALRDQKNGFAKDEFQERYYTKEVALARHRVIVKEIKRELDKK